MTDAEILLELWKERAERQARQIEKLKALVVKMNAENIALKDAIKTAGGAAYTPPGLTGRRSTTPQPLRGSSPCTGEP